MVTHTSCHSHSPVATRLRSAFLAASLGLGKRLPFFALGPRLALLTLGTRGSKRQASPRNRPTKTTPLSRSFNRTLDAYAPSPTSVKWQFGYQPTTSSTICRASCAQLGLPLPLWCKRAIRGMATIGAPLKGEQKATANKTQL